MVWLCLQLAQMPIIMLTFGDFCTDNRRRQMKDKTDHFTTCVCGTNKTDGWGRDIGVQKRYIAYDKIFAGQNFAKPSYLCIAEIFSETNFCQCSKGCHILNVIINTGQKIHAIKISPRRADGEIGESFLLAKISAYTVQARVVTSPVAIYFLWLFR